MRAGFLCPKCNNFASLHIRQAQNELHLKRLFFFFAKIGIFCRSFAGTLSEAKTYCMVNWRQLLKQLNIAWRHTKVFMQNSSQWCLRNNQLLRTTVNWCWCHFTHTFCHNSNILGCTHCYLLYTLWLIDEDVSFFQFFHKITNIRSWRIFTRILQHYHDFQNNVAIFASVVQAYTQPYSFGGRIKLIICQIRHELSVTIHEISTSWQRKKTLDGGPNICLVHSL